MGEKDRARELYQQALAVSPTFALASQRLHALR
jgi:hypothetical protein